MFENIKMPSQEEVAAVEAHARDLRAQAMANGFRAAGAAIARAFGYLTSAVRRPQHG